MFKKKTGPAKVEAAFGLFNKAITDLEGAVVTCRDEAFDYREKAEVAKVAAINSDAAGDKAEVAIRNLRKLLGG
jgi:hypothetical protein